MAVLRNLIIILGTSTWTHKTDLSSWKAFGERAASAQRAESWP